MNSNEDLNTSNDSTHFQMKLVEFEAIFVVVVTCEFEVCSESLEKRHYPYDSIHKEEIHRSERGSVYKNVDWSSFSVRI